MRLPFLPKEPDVRKVRFYWFQEGPFMRMLGDLRKTRRYRVIEEDTYFHREHGGVIVYERK